MVKMLDHILSKNNIEINRDNRDDYGLNSLVAKEFAKSENKSLLRKATEYASLGLALIGIIGSVSCGGKTPDPVDKTFGHGLTLSAYDLMNKANLSGEIITIRERDNYTIKGNIGTRIDLLYRKTGCERRENSFN